MPRRRGYPAKRRLSFRGRVNKRRIIRGPKRRMRARRITIGHRI